MCADWLHTSILTLLRNQEKQWLPNKLMTKKNLLIYDLFKDDFLDSLIFHIPHASTHIPADLGESLNKNLLQHEINLLTDWATDSIFEVPGTTQVLAKFSRIFCDVERLPDADEPMYACGRGFFYTKTDAGQDLRQENDIIKNIVFKEFYQNHHIRLTDYVQQKLNKHNFAIIIVIRLLIPLLKLT
jgi:N-formylglutamate deformylase